MVFLDRLVADFTAVVSLPDFLAWIVRVLGEELGYDTCAAALVNDHNPELLTVGAASGELAHLRGGSISARSGPFGAALRTGTAALAATPGGRLAAGKDAAAYVPLMRRGRAVGVLRASRRPPGTMTEDDLALLTSIVRYLGSALEVAFLHQEAKDVSGTDALTGLANRRAFLDRIESEMARGRRRGERLSIALLDMNGFKGINDVHGHWWGDQALALVGRALVSTIRRSDLAVRYGGDEFVILMPEAGAAQAEVVMARLGEHDLSMEAANGAWVALRLSWGIATWPDDAPAVAELLQIADSRLYAMKRAMARGSVASKAAAAPAPRRRRVRVPIALAATAAAVILAAVAMFGAGVPQHAVLAYRSGPAPVQQRPGFEPPSQSGSAVSSPKPTLSPGRSRGRRVLVVSGLLPTWEAGQDRQALLAAGFIPSFRHMVLTPETSRLFYGACTSVTDARALAGRVRAAGYPAFVIVL